MRLIDADALMEKIEEYWEIAHIQTITRKTKLEQALWTGTHGGMNYSRNLVLEAPTIEAEPVRHGRWEMRGGKRYCTNCGKQACVTRDSDDFWYTVGTDYCPNCGAKMDGEGEKQNGDRT